MKLVEYQRRDTCGSKVGKPIKARPLTKNFVLYSGGYLEHLDYVPRYLVRVIAHIPSGRVLARLLRTTTIKEIMIFVKKIEADKRFDWTLADPFGSCKEKDRVQLYYDILCPFMNGKGKQS